MDGPWESTSLPRLAHLSGRQCDRRCGPTRTASRTLSPSSSRTATVSRTATESGTARAEWAPPWDEGAIPGVQPRSQPIRLSGAPLFKAKASCAMAGPPPQAFPDSPGDSLRHRLGHLYQAADAHGDDNWHRHGQPRHPLLALRMNHHPIPSTRIHFHLECIALQCFSMCHTHNDRDSFGILCPSPRKKCFICVPPRFQ